MKMKFILPLMAVAMMSCSGNKAATESEETKNDAPEAKELSLDGKWRLADYPGENEMVVLESPADYYLSINLADSTYSMTTDCNSLLGKLTLTPDSISFGDVASTLMACPTDSVERAMKTILPMVTSYVITPDSTLILRADARTMAQFKYAGAVDNNVEE